MSEGLQKGDRAPDFVTKLAAGAQTRFYSRAGGRPTVIAFCDAKEAGCVRRLSESLAGEAPVFAVFRGVAGGLPHLDGVTVFIDEDDAVTAGYRLGPDAAPTAFVLDANLRVTETLAIGNGKVDAADAVRRASLTVDAREVRVQAPVLLVPNVLDPEICRFLCNVWERGGSEETGVETTAGEGRAEVLDVAQKRRRDHVVSDEKLMQLLTSTVGKRVMPEVQRAFHYRATRFEGFKIACYESASSGFFSPHRDNLSPSTAHRRFALTLNLNADYAGGHLRFPEFGPHLYKPSVGEALVFSCSILHEVTPVTEGRRFTLLSFLFGHEQERGR